MANEAVQWIIDHPLERGQRIVTVNLGRFAPARPGDVPDGLAGRYLRCPGPLQEWDIEVLFDGESEPRVLPLDRCQGEPSG